jgi:hypothetical protein
MKGIVYKIVSGDECYVGSTSLTLKERIKKHKCDYKRYKQKLSNNTYASFILFEKYGFDNCIFEIIIERDFIDEEDKLTAEQFWIDELNSVNKKKAIHFTLRTDGRKAYTKEYYINNKGKYQSNGKRWRDENKERLQEKHKKWNEEHKEERKIKSAEWYKQNKDKMTMDITCECGVVYKKNNKSNHIKTKKHKKWIENSTK